MGQMREICGFGVAALLAGCSASSVNVRNPSTSLYAPVNESDVVGEVSYCNAGAKSIRDARRHDAYQKMHTTCAGAYEIVREEDQRPVFCAMERRIWFTCATTAGPAMPKLAEPALTGGQPAPREPEPAERCESCARLSVP